LEPGWTSDPSLREWKSPDVTEKSMRQSGFTRRSAEELDCNRRHATQSIVPGVCLRQPNETANACEVVYWQTPLPMCRPIFVQFGPPKSERSDLMEGDASGYFVVRPSAEFSVDPARSRPSCTGRRSSSRIAGFFVLQEQQLASSNREGRRRGSRISHQLVCKCAGSPSDLKDPDPVCRFIRTFLRSWPWKWKSTIQSM
jgi:hypothetical protein